MGDLLQRTTSSVHIEMDASVHIEMDNNVWPTAYFEGLLAELRSRRDRQRRLVWGWRGLAFIPIPLSVGAWLIGAMNLSATNAPSVETASGIALLVFGAITVFLEQVKPRKYLQIAKHHMEGYASIVKQLEFQLALAPEKRKDPQALLDTTLRKIKLLCAGDAPNFAAAASPSGLQEYKVPLQ